MDFFYSDRRDSGVTTNIMQGATTLSRLACPVVSPQDRQERPVSARRYTKQAVKSKRISDAEDVGGRVSVEAEADVKIDLLGFCQQIFPAAVEEAHAGAAAGIVPDIFDEQGGPLGQLLFQHEGRLGGLLVRWVGGKEE